MQPVLTAWRVSATVSGSAQQPVPGISTAGLTLSSISRSSRLIRSLAASELASLVVPNTASPSAPSSSSHRQ
jgi:hypothetical protein